MQNSTSIPGSWLGLFGLAAVVIILAGLRAISDIITPFLLAGFLMIICLPALTWLQKKGVPNIVSFVLLFVSVGISFFLLFLALKGAAESLAHQAPHYQAQLVNQINNLQDLAIKHGVPKDMIPDSIPLPTVGTLTGMAKQTASTLGHFTAYTLFVLLVFMFLLLEERSMRNRVVAAFPKNKRLQVRIRQFFRSVNRYLAVKTVASVSTGIFIGIGLALIGVDFPVLWGVVAGLLNFIPTIGSIAAAVPGVALAFLGLGVTDGFITLLLYIVVNTVIGSIIEPRYLGQTLGLSPVIVLVSLLLWGWILGPVGMLLSILLTMIAKLALESNPQTRWVSIMMSDNVKINQ